MYPKPATILVVQRVNLQFWVKLETLWSKMKKKNTDKIAIQSFTVPRAREWANKWTDERVAQYFSLYSWLFWTTAGERDSIYSGVMLVNAYFLVSVVSATMLVTLTYFGNTSRQEMWILDDYLKAIWEIFGEMRLDTFDPSERILFFNKRKKIASPSVHQKWSKGPLWYSLINHEERLI